MQKSLSWGQGICSDYKKAISHPYDLECEAATKRIQKKEHL
jgi:hypothetical protein